jgi:Fe-S cluster assembly iron-binding protein IscA
MCSDPNHSHDVDWEYQNKLNEQWKIDNPNAKSDGWWSI